MNFRPLLIMLMAVFCTAAFGQTVQTSMELTWQRPTLRVDGTPFPVSQQNSTKCEYRELGESIWLWGSNQPDPAAETLSFQITLAPGDYEFACRAEDTDGLWSDYSSVALVSIPLPPNSPPAAPGDLTVTVIVTVRVNP